MSIFEYKLQDKKGGEVSLKDFEGQVLLIANTASKCGFTPQYEGLEKLYKKYKEQGFTILAVPSNQFGEQEPGSNDEVQQFCRVNYGVSFPVMGKADVRGETAIPLFKYLTKEKGFHGFPPSEMTDVLLGHIKKNLPADYLDDDQIKWNFTKFLINKKGEVVERFEPAVTPAEMEAAVEKLLAE
ncbi:glutathione peroxidase [Selenomonas sp. TAMA-11512]|uniref:glutathione peroxidase n=1 Tax=Selenomonas sp. TAMA-11512 TaxID=3095337 RepID=UPI003087D48C|nr:glutathione peroxidase [Selenomonas sp. TAMA-11512]